MLRTTYARDFPEIVVNNHDCERSEFGTIEIRYTSRPSELWGHSETEGTWPKRSYERTEVTRPLHPDEIHLNELLSRLSEQGVAGVTFTTTDPIGLAKTAKAKNEGGNAYLAKEAQRAAAQDELETQRKDNVFLSILLLILTFVAGS